MSSKSLWMRQVVTARRRVASVSVRQGTWYFCPSDETPTGLYCASEPVIVRSEEASSSELGAAVLAALSLSRKGVQVPGPDFERRSAVLLAARVKSWSTFAKGQQYLSVTVEGGAMEIVPSRRTRGAGFEFLRASCVSASADASLEEVGVALRHALEACR